MSEQWIIFVMLYFQVFTPDIIKLEFILAALLGRSLI